MINCVCLFDFWMSVQNNQSSENAEGETLKLMFTFNVLNSRSFHLYCAENSACDLTLHIYPDIFKTETEKRNKAFKQQNRFSKAFFFYKRQNVFGFIFFYNNRTLWVLALYTAIYRPPSSNLKKPSPPKSFQSVASTEGNVRSLVLFSENQTFQRYRAFIFQYWHPFDFLRSLKILKYNLVVHYLKAAVTAWRRRIGFRQKWYECTGYIYLGSCCFLWI